MSESSTQHPHTIEFSYLKSGFFRVVHVDGAFASLGPSTVVLSIFNERLPIPQVQVFPIGEDNRLGAEITDSRVTRKGVIREVEFALAMSVRTAEELRDLLTKQIDAAKSIGVAG